MNIINEYIDCANYVSICQMYIKDIDVSENRFKLKEYTPGHWGCTPAINTLIGNLSYYAKKNNIKMQVVIGTGHAGSALCANLFLQNKLKELDVLKNKNGLNRIINLYGDSLRTEINPFYPQTIYDGGELGYSLAFSHGVCLKNDVFLPCIIGDGEAETSALCAAWQLNRISKTKGFLLPIINLNGLKMESNTYLSNLSNIKLKQYFKVYGYKVYCANSKNIYQTINKCFQDRKKGKSPMIIYKSIKGETIPEYMGNKIAGTIKAHKNPLSNLSIEEKEQHLKAWLSGYYIDNLLKKDSFKEFEYDNYIFHNKKLILPKNIDYKKEDTLYSPTRLLDEYIMEIQKKNKDFLITSPDELRSNKFFKVAKNKNFEILNENLCELLLQGHTISGNHGLMISYEAFASVNTSILSQYAKYLYQYKKTTNKRNLPSLNFILTSTCYENNYSHQNPEFVANIMNKEWSFVNAYYPKDANSAVRCLKESLNSEMAINIITTSKGELKVYDNPSTTIETIYEDKNAQTTILVTGDYVLREVMELLPTLQKEKIKVKIIYITNLSILKDKNDSIKQYISNKNIIYLYEGYSSVIKNLLYNSINNIRIVGYKDKSDISGDTHKKLKANKLDKKSIYKMIIG